MNLLSKSQKSKRVAICKRSGEATAPTYGIPFLPGSHINREQIIFSMQKALMKAYSSALMNHNLCYEADLPQGARILVANHPTTSDPFLLSLLVNQPLYIPITGMAFEVPLLGSILHAAGHIPVVKDRPGKQDVVGQAVDKLAAGKTIGIFPEGTLSPAVGSFCPPRTGAARMALLSGAPVIPVGIYLSENAFIEKQFATQSYTDTARWAVHGDYFVTVGAPQIYTGDVCDHDYVRDVSRQIMASIAEQARKSQERMRSQRARLPERNPLLRLREVFNG